MTETTPQLTVIVPTRNETANIEPLLQRLSAALAALSFAVLFVDDSDDNTPAKIQAMAVTFDFPIKVITRPPQQRDGLSGAVVAGLRAANSEWVCVMDADLQHPPELVPIMLERAQETKADIVVGSRKAEWYGPRGLSRKRALTSQMLTLLARMWFPRLLKNVSDPLTGLFLVRRTAVNVADLRPDGFKILLEILIRCPGLRVSELHFDFAGRHDGESKADFREGMRFFRHLTKLRATANQSFPRLILVTLGSMLLDTALFVILTQGTPWPIWLTAVLSAELFIFLRFAITEKWVLGGGHPVAGWPSFSRFFVSNQLSLFLLRLPLLFALLAWAQWSLWLAPSGPAWCPTGTTCASSTRPTSTSSSTIRPRRCWWSRPPTSICPRPRRRSTTSSGRSAAWAAARSTTSRARVDARRPGPLSSRGWLGSGRRASRGRRRPRNRAAFPRGSG
jgi:dolichol-phosphate mannosyltransferase